MANNQGNVPAEQGQPKMEVVYKVAGQDVKLNYNIVKSYLTKGDGNVGDQDILNFISICKYNQLNPFLNEAYLIKFGTAPATMVVSKEAFFKRAEESENYEGIQAGIIVMRGEEAVELEGTFSLSTDKLVGGWAKVYRKDRKYPIVAKVSLSEYDKKKSSWNEKPSTMISKVAKVQALREAFPSQLGSMYTQEEQSVTDATYEDLSKVAEQANATTITIKDDPIKEESKVSEDIPQAFS